MKRHQTVRTTDKLSDRMDVVTSWLCHSAYGDDVMIIVHTAMTRAIVQTAMACFAHFASLLHHYSLLQHPFACCNIPSPRFNILMFLRFELTPRHLVVSRNDD
jgi:hypothetical protein